MLIDGGYKVNIINENLKVQLGLSKINLVPYNLCMADQTIAKPIPTLIMGSQLSVECKGPWSQKNVFRCETNSQKWGRVQGMEPNDSQMHCYFVNQSGSDALPSHGGETPSEGLIKLSCGIETW